MTTRATGFLTDPLYRWVALESPIPDIVAALLGPDVEFHHSKLNLKGSHLGALQTAAAADAMR